MQSRRTFILGTAGHVDHGKTALVRALTGRDTDRLREEHRRGISIELGFAHLDLDEHTRLGIVDVPGHEKFVRQMVAGAGGMDLALLLVAADESVMPQTVEHLDVLRLLGVRSGLVVLTKIDLVEKDIVELVKAEVEDLVRGTFLQGSRVVPVSSTTGEGLDDLRAALLELTKSVQGRSRAGDFRLPIDRVFTLSGTGVVVTGTAWSGEVHPGDRLRLLPSARETRVREVESHDESVKGAGAGERVALSLRGVKKDELNRGEVLVSGASWDPSLRISVRLDAVSSLRAPIKQRARVHVHHAAREVLGRVDLLESNALESKESALARVYLEEPLVAAPGDRFVLRSYSPMLTIAGGRVIDPFTPERERRSHALERIATWEAEGRARWPFLRIREAGLNGRSRSDFLHDCSMVQLFEEQALAALTAALQGGELLALSDLLVSSELAAQAGSRALDQLRAYRKKHPLAAGMSKEELRAALGFTGGGPAFNQLLANWSASFPLFVVEDRVSADSKAVEVDRATQDRLDELQREIEAASPVFEADDALARSPQLALLIKQGSVVRLSGKLFAARVRLDELVAKVAAHFETAEVLEVATVKNWTHASRKFVVPLLEWLDSQDVTSFTSGRRTKGPGCPSR
jgi:selenocysteine-specific elongation factor